MKTFKDILKKDLTESITISSDVRKKIEDIMDIAIDKLNDAGLEVIEDNDKIDNDKFYQNIIEIVKNIAIMYLKRNM